ETGGAGRGGISSPHRARESGQRTVTPVGARSNAPKTWVSMPCARARPGGWRSSGAPKRLLMHRRKAEIAVAGPPPKRLCPLELDPACFVGCEIKAADVRQDFLVAMLGCKLAEAA